MICSHVIDVHIKYIIFCRAVPVGSQRQGVAKCPCRCGSRSGIYSFCIVVPVLIFSQQFHALRRHFHVPLGILGFCGILVDAYLRRVKQIDVNVQSAVFPVDSIPFQAADFSSAHTSHEQQVNDSPPLDRQLFRLPLYIVKLIDIKVVDFRPFSFRRSCLACRIVGYQQILVRLLEHSVDEPVVF